MTNFFIDAQKQILYKLYRNENDFEENLLFLSSSLNNFITQEVAPFAHETDEKEFFPVNTFRKLGDLGFMALTYPETYGGFNISFSYYIAGLESLSKADAGFTLGVAIHGTVADGIFHFASTYNKKKYLQEILEGKKIAAFALTEPDSGSDAQNLKTSYTYDKQNKQYILNGTKFWITNGLSADVFFVMARNQDKISAFLVDKNGTGNFEQQKISEKLGVRGSNTAELIFSDYKIPESALIGKEGEGFKYAMKMLNGGRVTIASLAVGNAQAAYEKLLKYSHERKLFGKHLKDLENTKKELSEMLIQIQSSRELTFNAAFYKDSPNVMQLASLAKVQATETAVRTCERVIQLCGGYSYIKESKIERHLRDALLGRIGEGANELLKINVIPRSIYKEYEQKPITTIW